MMNLVYFCLEQKQAIGHNRNAAYGHGHGSKDGMKLSQKCREKFKRIEHSCCNGDKRNIIKDFLGADAP